MGIFDKVNTDSDSKDEVVVDVSERNRDFSSGSSGSSSGKLEDEVETRLTSGERSTGKSRETESRSTRSVTSTDVSLEDIHDQNERIISLLESLTGETETEKDENDMAGGLNGVL